MSDELARIEAMVSRAISDEDGRDEVLGVLVELAERGPGGGVRKAARRGLHRLASRGISLASAPPVVAPERTKEKDVYMVLASPIDGAGNRGIWFAFRRGSEVDFVSLLISDQEGVKDAFARDWSLSKFDREAKRMMGDEEFPWIEIPADYARYLVDRAHRLNATSGVSLPLEFLAWRESISRPENSYEKPIVYSVINAAEVRWEPRHLDNSGRLFDLEMFKSWILEQKEVESFVNEKMTAQRTGLVLAGASGEAREELIEDRAIQSLFDARRRTIFKFRLEEMAYVLWKLGRLEMAKSALAAALALEPFDRSLAQHLFVRELVRWSLDVVMAMARSERARPVRPGVQIELP